MSNSDKADDTKLRIKEILVRLGFEGGESLKEKLVSPIYQVFRHAPDSAPHKYTKANGSNGVDASKIPPRLLQNVTILSSMFGLTTQQISNLIYEEKKISDDKLDLALEMLRHKAGVYSGAASVFSNVCKQISGKTPLEELKLLNIIQSASSNIFPATPAVGGVKLVNAIEDLTLEDGYQEGEPSAVCKVVEHYIDLGAFKIAQGLLNQALEQAENHAGLWFLKARLSLLLSSMENRKAFNYRLSQEWADPMSREEENYQFLEDEAAGKAYDWREQVFEICLKAFSLLPDLDAFDKDARQWSNDFGDCRKLRENIIHRIVHEAGRKCWPFIGNDNKRVLARLGRCAKYIPPETWVIDEEENKRLSKEPVFSSENDRIVISAYKEWITDKYYSHGLAIGPYLWALNLVRVFLPEQYRDAVSEFIQKIKELPPQTACDLLRPYDGIQNDYGSDNIGTLLHDHLDAVMSRDEQRRFSIELYEAWESDIHQKRDNTLRSIYDDQIRAQFEAGQCGSAYSLACQAEDEGVFLRSNGSDALRLKRTAQWAAQDARKRDDACGETEITERHLQDEAMSKLAESYFDTVYEDWDLDSYAPKVFYSP